MSGKPAGKPILLAVDRNPRNLDLLAQFLRAKGYELRTAATLEEFAQTLDQLPTIRLVLIDISGFDRHIWTQCERLRENQIPFLILSPRQSSSLQQASLAHGASSVLIKPLVVKELLGIIYGLLGE